MCWLKGSLGAVVKLLPCDHEVTGSSPGNSLLQKCRERLRTIDPKWSDPSPDPEQAGATCTGLPFFFRIVSKVYLTKILVMTQKLIFVWMVANFWHVNALLLTLVHFSCQ